MKNNSGREDAIKPLSHWHTMLAVAFCALLLWFLEFAVQYWRLARGEIEISLVRSFSFTGAMLIGCALLTSSIFRWFPRTARYWRVRRYLGVSGFIFIFLHSQAALRYVFNYDFADAYYSLNPFKNPLVFGSFAYLILLVMALTSSDFAVGKLTPKVWKFVHRFVYIAYPAAIFHFLLIAPKQLQTLPGYMLLAVTSTALAGQLWWFFVVSERRKFRSQGFFIGLAVIIIVLAAALFAFW